MSHEGTGLLTGNGNFSGEGFTEKSGTGLLSENGQIQGIGEAPAGGFGLISENGNISGFGLIDRAGTGSITENGSFTGSGYSLREGTGNITGGGVWLGHGRGGQGYITGNGSFEGEGYREPAGRGAITGGGSIVAEGDNGSDVRPNEGVGEISARGNVLGWGFVPVRFGVGNITTETNIIGQGFVEKYGSGLISENGIIRGVGESIGVGVGNITGNGSIEGVGEAVPAASGRIAGNGTIAGQGTVPNRFGIGHLSDNAGNIVGVGETPIVPMAEGVGRLSGNGNLVGVGETTFLPTGQVVYDFEWRLSTRSEIIWDDTFVLYNGIPASWAVYDDTIGLSGSVSGLETPSFRVIDALPDTEYEWRARARPHPLNEKGFSYAWTDWQYVKTLPVPLPETSSFFIMQADFGRHSDVYTFDNETGTSEVTNNIKVSRMDINPLWWEQGWTSSVAYSNARSSALITGKHRALKMLESFSQKDPKSNKVKGGIQDYWVTYSDQDEYIEVHHPFTLWNSVPGVRDIIPSLDFTLKTNNDTITIPSNLIKFRKGGEWYDVLVDGQNSGDPLWNGYIFGNYIGFDTLIHPRGNYWDPGWWTTHSGTEEGLTRGGAAIQVWDISDDGRKVLLGLYSVSYGMMHTGRHNADLVGCVELTLNIQTVGGQFIEASIDVKLIRSSWGDQSPGDEVPTSASYAEMFPKITVVGAPELGEARDIYMWRVSNNETITKEILSRAPIPADLPVQPDYDRSNNVLEMGYYGSFYHEGEIKDIHFFFYEERWTSSWNSAYLHLFWLDYGELDIGPMFYYTVDTEIPSGDYTADNVFFAGNIVSYFVNNPEGYNLKASEIDWNEPGTPWNVNRSFEDELLGWYPMPWPWGWHYDNLFGFSENYGAFEVYLDFHGSTKCVSLGMYYADWWNDHQNNLYGVPGPQWCWRTPAITPDGVIGNYTAMPAGHAIFYNAENQNLGFDYPEYVNALFLPDCGSRNPVTGQVIWNSGLPVAWSGEFNDPDVQPEMIEYRDVFPNTDGAYHTWLDSVKYFWDKPQREVRTGRIGSGTIVNQVMHRPHVFLTSRFWPKTAMTGLGTYSYIDQDGKLYVGNWFEENTTNRNYDELTIKHVHPDSKWNMVTCDSDGHYLAIRDDNTLWYWEEWSSNGIWPPVRVGNGTDWVRAHAVTGGTFVALRLNKSLWTWGNNQNGQCGLGHTNFVSEPTEVGGTNWIWIGGNQGKTFALNSSGFLYGTGMNLLNAGDVDTFTIINTCNTTSTARTDEYAALISSPNNVHLTWPDFDPVWAGNNVIYVVKNNSTLEAIGSVITGKSGSSWTIDNLTSWTTIGSKTDWRGWRETKNDDNAFQIFDLFFGVYLGGMIFYPRGLNMFGNSEVYYPPENHALEKPGHMITSITVTDGGSGYRVWSGSSWVINAQATLVGGDPDVPAILNTPWVPTTGTPTHRITSISVNSNNRGINYRSIPEVVITGSGTGATAVANLESGPAPMMTFTSSYYGIQAYLNRNRTVFVRGSNRNGCLVKDGPEIIDEYTMIYSEYTPVTFAGDHNVIMIPGAGSEIIFAGPDFDAFGYGVKETGGAEIKYPSIIPMYQQFFTIDPP